MSYSTKSDKVYWNNKELKGLNSKNFKVLHPKIATHEEDIFFGSKKLNFQKRDFKVLNENYAKNSKSCFEILNSKLKEIKKADPKTFKVIGDLHAVDKNIAFFRGKKIPKANVDNLISINPIFACDDKHLFYTTRSLKLPNDCNYKNLQVETFKNSQNEINMPNLILKTKDKAFINLYDSPKSPWRQIEVEKKEIKNLTFLNDFETHQTNKKNVFFLGQKIKDLDFKSLDEPVGSVLTSGSKKWLGTLRLDQNFEYKKEDKLLKTKIKNKMVHITDDFYSDEENIWKMHCTMRGESKINHLCIRKSLNEESLKESLKSAFIKIFQTTGSLFKQLPMTFDPEYLPTPIEEKEVPNFDLDLSGDQVLIKIKGKLICKAQVTAFMKISTAFWSEFYKRDNRLEVNPPLKYMGSEIEAFLMASIRTAQKELISLSTALFKEGQIQQAEIITHLVLNSRHIRYPKNELELGQLYSLFELDLLKSFEKKYFLNTGKSTHLSAGKYVIEQKLLEHNDFRIRFLALCYLNDRVKDTNNLKKFLIDVLPHILEYHAKEPLEWLSSHFLDLIEMSIIKAFVDFEVRSLSHHKAIEPYVRYQIKNKANTLLNKARLIECLWAQDKITEAQGLEEELLSEAGDTSLAPPMYANRIYWQNYRFWLLAAKVRLIWRTPLKKEVLLKRHDECLSELKILYKYFGSPGKWDDFKPDKKDGAPRAKFDEKQPWEDFKVIRQALSDTKRDIESLSN